MGYMVLPSLRHPAWGINFHQDFNLSSPVPFLPYNTSPSILFLLATVEGTVPDFEWCLGAGGRCLVDKATSAAWTLFPISCSEPGGFVLQTKSGHGPSTGVQEYTTVITVNGFNAKTESIASKLINFFFVCQSYTSGHLIISTESENN